MDFTQTPGAPQPAGHYSQAVRAGGLVYVSGQLPIHPESREIPKGIEKQCELVLDHLEAILEAAGSSLGQVVQCRVYVSDISLWGKVNEIYARRFGGHKPARAVVPTRDLHFGCLIELEAVAECE